jgi:transcription initiation factor IIE alpha subunit
MDKKFEDLPCSAKLVLKVIEMKGRTTFKELKEETLLPDRTLREAIRILKERGAIRSKICLDDTRTRYYEISCLELTEFVDKLEKEDEREIMRGEEGRKI